jgi:hypothetical protein
MADGGHAQGPLLTLEQQSADLGLQFLDATAERGLGHVQPGCGPCEAALIGHGAKIAELADVDVHAASI